MNEYCFTTCSLIAVKRGNPLIRLCHSLTHTHTCSHTHTNLHTLTRTCSSAKPTSLNPARTSPSVSVQGGLGCRLLPYWTEPSGKCPSIGCCQLVKSFCYHGCRVSCPNVSQCTEWCWWNCWHPRCYAEKKKKTSSDGSQGCREAAPKSLSTDARKWAHMVTLHLQQQREDETDHQNCDHHETAQRNTSCMKDVLWSQSCSPRKKTGPSNWAAVQERLSCHV